jgi:hypothetical protein
MVLGNAFSRGIVMGTYMFDGKPELGGKLVYDGSHGFIHPLLTADFALCAAYVSTIPKEQCTYSTQKV